MTPQKLLFDWPTRHHVHLVLPLMLVVSFALHALGVVVFRAARPQSRPSPERAARVWFLPPGSPQAARVMPMLAASDPAVFSPGEISARDRLSRPESEYVPSFDSESPELVPLPEAGRKMLGPVGPVVAAVRSDSPAPAPPPARPGLPTRLRPGGDLADREVALPADAAFHAPPRQGLLPLEFLVSVSPQGRVLYLFPMNSSGNETIDREALRVLTRARFAARKEAPGATWGTATFLWGADVDRVKNRRAGERP